MTQQNNDDKPSALKRFGKSVAKKNGFWTWLAFIAIAIAMVVTFLQQSGH
ncbi:MULTISPECIES: hypothetical protein [Paraburkholderia]|uniref:Uncharacterized protein n=1 Tax=Paraburkholderia madseniana TaxID=2599607 RepID=A0AAP5BMQ8_9BURK|nr:MULTISPECIES: hypothetical protein [Paraburkholderia]MCX4151018.1 hypothetical protein [Paraburkholderia madseniana]MCX4176658.1 hypothetical protein [Paraburkholderia madseniana]MDN7153950.1 hypothetical protein [Paraburkholderia sp. WS6]MDQ6412832.1 hypothetical protein [Paraburkholderia madseniana]MDQ6464649.1 hypothetical protein [Paraburkholderia madseniana]